MTTNNKPIGYFDHVLAVDCETTGIAYGVDDPSFDPATGKEYQAIDWGFVVADSQTLEPIEKLQFYIKWDGKSIWDPRAEKVHGLTKEFLEKNGIDEVTAVEKIANLVLKYWGPKKTIKTVGCHTGTFDNWFLKRLTRKQQIDFRYGNSHVDAWSLGFILLDVYNSEDLFNAVGLPPRGRQHTALDDAEKALEAMRKLKQIGRKVFQDDSEV